MPWTKVGPLLGAVGGVFRKVSTRGTLGTEVWRFAGRLQEGVVGLYVSDRLLDVERLLAKLLQVIHDSFGALVLPHLFQHILHKTHVPVFLVLLIVLFILLPPSSKERQSSFPFSSLQN